MQMAPPPHFRQPVYEQLLRTHGGLARAQGGLDSTTLGQLIGPSHDRLLLRGDAFGQNRLSYESLWRA